MSFLKQDFILYMQNAGYVNPGAYCNGFDNIERLLAVDIDAEFSKDECEWLYNRLQNLRRNPEEIGKNEHTIRQYASQLNRYIEFRKAQKENPITNKDTYTEKFCVILNSYKDDFEIIDENERYKWEAVKWYKNHWNINADNFGDMVKIAFSKADNLLTSAMYYAYAMLIEFSSDYPEKARSLFRVLYNEDLSLDERYSSFRAGFDEYIKIRKENSENKDKKLQHYQDMHAISVYLFFEYPENYFIYKSKIYNAIKERIGFVEEKTNQSYVVDKYDNYSRLCRFLINEIPGKRPVLCELDQTDIRLRGLRCL